MEFTGLSVGDLETTKIPDHINLVKTIEAIYASFHDKGISPHVTAAILLQAAFNLLSESAIEEMKMIGRATSYAERFMEQEN